MSGAEAIDHIIRLANALSEKDTHDALRRAMADELDNFRSVDRDDWRRRRQLIDVLHSFARKS